MSHKVVTYRHHTVNTAGLFQLQTMNGVCLVRWPFVAVGPFDVLFLLLFSSMALSKNEVLQVPVQEVRPCSFCPFVCSGPGDSFYSSAFQSTIIGNPLYTATMPECTYRRVYISHRARITLCKYHGVHISYSVCIIKCVYHTVYISHSVHITQCPYRTVHIFECMYRQCVYHRV